MIHVDEIPSMVKALQLRHQGRDSRMDLIDKAVTGDFGLTDEHGTPIEAEGSPNLIQVALEDSAEAASIVPSVKVDPSSHERKDDAAEMTRYAAGYLDLSQIPLLTIRSMLDLYAYGQLSWVVRMNEEGGVPYIEWRNPRTCYQERGWHAMDSARRVVFLRDMYLSQLPEEWQTKVFEDRAYHVEKWMRFPKLERDHQVTLVEIYTEEEQIVAALFRAGTHSVPGVEAAVAIPVELDRKPTVGGVCPAVVTERLTLDTQPRGQFDQVIRVMKGHMRLMETLLDYADQAVYSDVWVKDLIGQMPVGGGSYIQLGPQGGIGRVQPAVSSLQVFEELDRLMDGVHLGGRWPKVRPGEVDQSIASAKFIEASAGMMNTTIRTMHLLMTRALEQSLRVCFVQAKRAGRKRSIGGVLKNQQFVTEHDPAKIDLGARVKVEYGVGLGREPAQAMVLGIQANQAGLVSTEFVQENFEGLTDVERERRRIDLQQLRDMAIGRLMQGMESGEIPMSALTEIAKARANGDDMFDLFEKYIVKPAEEAQDQMLTSGLDGSQMMPGAPPPALSGGAAPPPAPAPEELLGLGAGAGPPTSINRTSVPLGPGSFAGVESRSN